MRFPEQLRNTLLEIARQSIKHGLTYGKPLRVDARRYEKSLSEPGASFVTLRQQGQLRGCIGSLEAYRALICDVADNAFAAAFRDPRFPHLKEAELAGLTLDISVLSPPESLEFDSEQDLLQQIRPDIDGLIIQDGNHRGTFLPSVWESLPKPGEFLHHLKLKAGLPADHWSDTVEVWRYTAEKFGDEES